MDATYAVNMTQQAADTPNVVMHGKVSHEKLDALYRRAAVLCCTSSLEGFPNTFLEAWSRGLPVVTTFDPDDTVARHKIGASVYDIEGLVSALDSILSDSTQRLEMSRNARRYFERNHLAEMVTNEFERVVHERLEVRNTDGPAADSRACS
jgi:glycosyltransferase involved in cell wall biosynthesis